MNKKVIVFSYMLLLFSNCCFSQEENVIKISDLNGIWRNATDTAQYSIFRNGKVIVFFYRPFDYILSEKNNNPFTFSGKDQFCFISKADSLWISCKNEGKSSKDYLLWGAAYAFRLERNKDMKDVLELESWNIFTHIRVLTLPNFIFKELYLQSKNDKNDYLRDFLGKNFKEIKVAKGRVHNSIDSPSKQYLIQGDPIEIIEQKGEWYKIRYYGKQSIEGWVRKKDVN